MRSLLFLFFALLINMSANAQHENHQASADTVVKAKSPRRSAMALVGKNHVHIDYGSPSVRGRNIWNGLVCIWSGLGQLVHIKLLG
jgi:hypothetical protein